MKISVITDISVFRFYGYIGYIGDILDISEIYWWIFWKKISIGLKLLKTHKNIKKPHNNIIRSIIDILKLFY